MSMTDPIADFLTRIRNALVAEMDIVDMPASRFKTEIARILQEQGYIEGYSTEPARVGQTLRVRLKYTEDRQPVISEIRRVPARAAHLRLRRADPQGARRHGHRDHVHLQRRDDRPRRPP